MTSAGKESGETSDMEVVLGGLASLNDEIEWFKSEGSKWGVDFSTVVAQKANQEYSREALVEAEDVLVRVLEHEVAFWEMSRGGQ
ncbi:hypothetical protein Bca52824_018919 [Brassica carinata]|uniref:Uncharacterized protein n=1 Tax=Brassica carinata TaxID=52824 RepID=A0A8X7VRD2_BRACI|nr:hypothetical protein Bca52824_018919 [Brassica carinata]